ncbi:anthrone oxygenase family protein [Streptomyces sp. NPDC047108]|uniref:anthrone oxygenase family protein n=1 Tax=Streptomyces sp. NPDC047108 TaxID=3155025 RepID=UPI0033E47F37
MLELARNAALIAATVSTGLMAGLFYAFAVSVMPGLGRTGDGVFVDAMQRINAAILNGWFALAFGGALVLTALAVALHIPGDGREPLPWTVAALVLYGAVLVITFAVNVPLNNELEAAGDAGRTTDAAAVRARFETSWVRWNVVRAVLNTGALGALAWALVLRGRA